MTDWIDQLGTQNPQFLRECRGRLKPRSVVAAIALSFIFQFLLYLSIADIQQFFDAEVQSRMFQTLSWTIPYALFVLGGYYIVDDLTREEKTGTLNFIRLSPRPAQEILVGKLFGVPILPMLVVASAAPLHIVSGLIGGEPVVLIMSYYLMLLAGAGFVFTLALLFGLAGASSALGKRQSVSAIAFAGLALFAIAPMFMLWNQAVVWDSLGEPIINRGDLYTPIEWLYLPLTSNPLVAHLFTLGNLALAALLLWQILLRKFRMPTATPLSKRLSYVGVAYLNALLWGFFQSSRLSTSNQQDGIILMAALNVPLFLSLIFALAPSRQTLLDRARTRSPQSVFTKSALTNWVWDDSSPSLVAIAINFIIAAGLIVSWLFLLDTQGEMSIAGGLLSTFSLGLVFLIYAAIVQIIYSMRLRSPQIWAIGVVASIAAICVISFSVLQWDSADPSNRLATLWTLYGLPIGFAVKQIAQSEGVNILGGVVVGILIQLIIFALLLKRLRRNLRRIGNS